MHTNVLFLSSLLIFASAAPLPQVLPVPTNLPSTVQGVTSGVGVDPASLHLTRRQIRNADFEASGPPEPTASSSGSSSSSASSPDSASPRSTTPSPTTASASPQLSRRIELSDVLKKLPLPLKRESSSDGLFIATRSDSDDASDMLLKRQLPIPVVGPMLGMLSGGGAKPEHFETPFEHDGKDEGPFGGSGRHDREMPDQFKSLVPPPSSGNSASGQHSKRIGENVNLWDVPVVDGLAKIHKRIGENVNLWDVPVIDGLTKVHRKRIGENVNLWDVPVVDGIAKGIHKRLGQSVDLWDIPVVDKLSKVQKRIGQSVDLYDIPVVDGLAKNLHSKRVGESVYLYEVPVVDGLRKLAERSEGDSLGEREEMASPEKRFDLGDESLPLGGGGIGKGIPVFASLASLGKMAGV